jgi:hypothetical protein
MPKGKKRLTPRRVKLLKELVKGKSIVDAEKAAGYSTKYPGQSGSQALAQIRATMPELLDRMGLTNESLIENYLKPALDAEDSRVVVLGGVKNQRTKIIKTPAWDPRLRALDMSFKLKGAYADKEDGPRIGVQVIVVDIPRPNRPASEPAVIEVKTSNGNGHNGNGSNGHER